MIDQNLITTSTALEGYRIVKHFGVVRGITVRSRSVFGNIAGGFQTLFWWQDFHLCRTLRKNQGRSFSIDVATRRRIMAQMQ